MRLINSTMINVLIYTKTFVGSTGEQTYTLADTVAVQASVLPYRISRSTDFGVDLVRLKDQWVVITNGFELLSDQSMVVQFNGNYFTVTTDEDSQFVVPSLGYFKSVIKLGVDQGYGLS